MMSTSFGNNSNHHFSSNFKGNIGIKHQYGEIIEGPQYSNKYSTINSNQNDKIVSTVNKRTTTVYPIGYKPRNVDVIVGKGVNSYNHIGNEMLRDMIASRLLDYAEAKDKKGKSKIVMLIIDMVNKNGGSFLKKNPTTGIWYTSEVYLVRNKISQTFRKALHESKNSNIKKQKQQVKEENDNNNNFGLSSLEPLPLPSTPTSGIDNSNSGSNIIINIPTSITNYNNNRFIPTNIMSSTESTNDEAVSTVLPNFGYFGTHNNNKNDNDDSSAANTLTTTDFVSISNHNNQNFGGEVFDFSDVKFSSTKKNHNSDSGSLSSLDIDSLSDSSDTCSFSETCMENLLS